MYYFIVISQKTEMIKKEGYTTSSMYDSIGGHAHTKLRSPYALSTRPTVGQNLFELTYGSGNAAFLRE